MLVMVGCVAHCLQPTRGSERSQRDFGDEEIFGFWIGYDKIEEE